MFDRLFLARNLCAELVKLSLHPVQLLTGFSQLLASLLDLAFGFTQVRGTLFHVRFGTGELASLGLDFRVKNLLLQQQALGFQAALILFQLLVLRCSFRLAVKARELLVDLVDQIDESIQVLARMSNPGFGFAAPLLVLGDACGLFEIDPQFIRLGIDDPAHHALLDNRVTAGP